MSIHSVILFPLLFQVIATHAQHFERIPVEAMFSTEKKIKFREILTTSKGDMIIIASMGFADINGGQFEMAFPTGGLEDLKGNPQTSWPSSNIFKDAYHLHTGFKCITEGPGQIIYLVSDNNNLGWIDYNEGKGFGIPPFNFPNTIEIRNIWIDRDGDLFIAARDSFFIVKEVTRIFDPKTGKLLYKSKMDKDSNDVITEGAKEIRGFSLGKNILPYCFAQDSEDNIYVGSNQGIFEFEKKTGLSYNIFKNVKNKQVTVTHISMTNQLSDLWFSTLENGMGAYNIFSKTPTYYPYKKNPLLKNPISNFIRVSDKEFLVAVSDSLPAFFNIENTTYEFIEDTSFRHTKNATTDIKTGIGKLTALIKDGQLYVSWHLLKDRKISNAGYTIGPYIKEIMVQGMSYKDRTNYLGRYDSLKTIHLKYYENNIDIIYAPRGVASSDTIHFASKLEGKWNDWIEAPYTMLDERINMFNSNFLKPGKYIFRVKMKKGKEDWLKNEIALVIIIEPPFWQTWWFWASVVAAIGLFTFLIVKWRVRSARRHEREKLKHEKELLEMEARALRAQMNPHFVFNCMNSIKALIQNDEKQRSIDYLTTFSKLIRTLFQNSDKRQITLYDEIETCKLYTQLEAMRLQGKLGYNFEIASNIDLKSMMVPALIVQPFIENAIWHGIVPKDKGNIIIRVYARENSIICEVDDDGIGRELSKQNKPLTPILHESKGVHLSQARLDLEKKLNDSNARIEIIDKYENNIPTGTKVIIEFNLQ